MRFFLLILIFFAFFASMNYALTNVSICQNLTIGGETYILNESFTATRASCLIIQNTSIVINGNGNTIAGGGFDIATNSPSGFGYSVENLTISNYVTGFNISNSSSFSNILMKDTVSGSLVFQYAMIIGDFPVTGNNVTMQNLTASVAVQATERSLGIFYSSNRSNSYLSNINFINNSIHIGGLGSFGVISSNHAGNFTYNNNTFANITFNNNLLNSSNLPGASSVVSIIAISSNGNINALGENNSFTGVNYTAFTHNVGSVGGSGIVRAAGTATNDILLNFSGMNISITSSNITSSPVVFTANTFASATDFLLYLTNINLTSPAIELYRVPSPSPGQRIAGIINYSGTIVNTIGLNSSFKINSASSRIFIVSDISTILVDPSGSRNVTSYLNYSTSNSSVNLSLFYTEPPLPYLESSIFTNSLVSSNWSLVNSGVLSTTNNLMLFDNLSVLGTNSFVGLFAQNPVVQITLNSPTNSSFVNSSSVIFNWTTIGSLPSYLSNLTIDGVLNVSSVASLNNTPVTQTVSGFSNGLHNWAVTSSNLTASNNSNTFFFTVDTIAPFISLTSPANNSTTSGTVNFIFNYTDALSPTASCSVILGGSNIGTNASTLNNTATTLSFTGLGAAVYNWSTQCTDLAGNLNTSQTFFFTFTSSGGGGGGGGGGSGTGNVTIPSGNTTGNTTTTTGGNTTNITLPSIFPPQPQAPSPAVDPGYYQNPPPGPVGLSPIADDIVANSNGQISQLPYACPVNLQQYNIIGGEFIDSILCQAKGILSLYPTASTSITATALILLFLLIIGNALPDKSSPIFYVIVALTIGTLVLGFDFLIFEFYGIIIWIGGGTLPQFLS